MDLGSLPSRRTITLRHQTESSQSSWRTHIVRRKTGAWLGVHYSTPSTNEHRSHRLPKRGLKTKKRRWEARGSGPNERTTIIARSMSITRISDGGYNCFAATRLIDSSRCAAAFLFLVPYWPRTDSIPLDAVATPT